MNEPRAIRDDQSEQSEDLMGFTRRDSWHKNKDWKNNEFFILCKEGIPTSLRAKVYSDVLKRKTYEKETLKRNNGKIKIDASMTLYENIRTDVLAKDCLAYHQVQEDVVSF